MEIEAKDTQLEAISEGGVTQVKHQSLEDTLWLADNIEKLVLANKKIFTYILKSSIPGDFVAFGKGEKETIEMRGAGCERVARDVGISFNNWSEKLENFEDSIGQGYRYIYEADAVFRSRVIRVMSIASSRTKFFGKEDGEFKEISEVNRDDVQVAARRGIHKEGVKALLGLRHLNRAELETYGVKIGATGGHDFKNKDQKAAETEVVKIKIKEVFVKSSKPEDKKQWKKYTIVAVEGGQYSTFDEKVATAAKAIVGKDQTATINFTKNEYGNNISSFVVDAEEPK